MMTMMMMIRRQGALIAVAGQGASDEARLFTGLPSTPPKHHGVYLAEAQRNDQVAVVDNRQDLDGKFIRSKTQTAPFTHLQPP
jgi:hypothetical protein